MVESYKTKSKIATLISFAAALIAYIGKDGLYTIIPPEYANLVPIIVFCAGYILSQSTENKRVDIAEQLIHEQYVHDVDPATEYENNDVVGDDDDC